MTKEDLYLELNNKILISNNIYGIPSEQSLFRSYLELLEGSGQLVDDFQEIEYGIEHNGITYSFCAFSKDVERGSINIVVSEFYSDETLPKLYKEGVSKYFEGCVSLFNDLLIPNKNQLDESNSLRELLDDISSPNKIFKKINVWLFTNSQFASRDSFSNNSGDIFNISTSCKLVELGSYIKLIEDQQNSNIEINTSLDSLKVIENLEYTSFLAKVSAEELVKYYDEYGKRLLESNVRTFLSLKRQVNKGIYNTIKSDEKIFFFAYNNGITATASDVVFDNNEISNIHNLQIVNGGQTISTIFKAFSDGLSISDIWVQMKLSVIHNKSKYSHYVSKISEYANTQNPVRKSDFFSNTYFHKQFKDISRRLRVTNKSGGSSKWFYERMSGEYLNDQMYKTKSQRNQFQLEYPKTQVVDKVKIAKAILSWDLLAYDVAKGGEKLFAKFADKVGDLYEEGDPECNDLLFQKSIAQYILFTSIEKMTSNADWYLGGHRSQTVTYIISTVSHILNQNKKTLDWLQIWDNQCVPKEIMEWISDIGEHVHIAIHNIPSSATTTNISSYSKKKECWERIKRLRVTQIELPDSNCIINLNSENSAKKTALKNERFNQQINDIVHVLEISKTDTPKRLIEFYNSTYAPGITDTQRGVLKSFYTGKIDYPTDRQARVIMSLVRKALKNGCVI